MIFQGLCPFVNRFFPTLCFFRRLSTSRAIPVYQVWSTRLSITYTKDIKKGQILITPAGLYLIPSFRDQVRQGTLYHHRVHPNILKATSYQKQILNIFLSFVPTPYLYEFP